MEDESLWEREYMNCIRRSCGSRRGKADRAGAEESLGFERAGGVSWIVSVSSVGRRPRLPLPVFSPTVHVAAENTHSDHRRSLNPTPPSRQTMRIQAHHYSRRQDDSLTVPTAAGLGAAQTAAATGAAQTGSLLLDGDAAAATASVTADLVVGSSAVVVTTSGASSLPSSSSTGVAHAAASGSSGKSGLGTGAMIGIIIAAFAGVLLVILVVYFSLRRRWASALDKAQRARQAQPWAKLDDSGQGDVWEGMEKKSSAPATTARSNTTKSVDTSARLSLFRKASSTRSGIDDNKSRLNQFDPSTMPNFATYHPDLAAELANEEVAPPSRPFAQGRDNDSERTRGTDSFLSLRLSDGSLAGALVKTVPPPSAAVPALHRWESAEVLTMDSDSMYATTSNADSSSPLAMHAQSNPFADDSAPVDLGRTKSGRNPFFGGAHENPFADQRRRSRAASEATRRSEDAPSLYPLNLDPGVTVPLPAVRRESISSVETVRAGPARPDSSVRPLSNQNPSPTAGPGSSAGMQGLLAALQGGEENKRGSYASSYPPTERSSVASWGGQAM
ncbi:unnamed protein product [Peniophora sp. CBMAI 1063]|nr:unnamed protein product [Peniophora sp. CBMAI 1063]